MAKNDLNLKLWLINQTKKSRNVPVFVIAKTARRITRNRRRRNWRRDKLLTKNVRRSLKKSRK